MNRMTEPDSFREWLDNPATQDFLKYLRERQMALMEAWGRGLMTSPEQQAQAVLLGRLSDLSFEDMIEHYQLETGDAA